MADGIEIEGMEELTDLVKNMTIEISDEKRAMRKAVKVVADEIEKNTPIRTGKLKKLSKTVKIEGLGVVGIVKSKQFYDVFEEFGTSQQKHNVGYFSNSVDNSKNEAIKILVEELLKRKLL